MDKAMQTIFCDRWGLWAVPSGLTREQQGQVLAISIGLGCLFNEEPGAERHWMETPSNGTTPIAMIFAGKYDEVLSKVNRERNV